MITLPDSRSHRLTPALGVGMVSVCVALTAFAGLLGLAAGVATVLVTVGLGPIAGIVIGHLVAVALLGTPTTAELVLFELSIIPLLATPLVERPSSRSALIVGSSVLGLMAIAVIAYTSVDSLWVLALGLVGGLAAIGYGLHRYELVVLGLVPDEALTSTGDR